ncbi:hypothetical protein N7447_009681 [Penicillium robsamsonii]|uniref:uncharacterized protein n=1 Tax=Penicillium robsamsonii TaxID=1792511 RepID=UPI00254693DF|nr:uncharacterized protein N7447_009681 [Penicillium robsamsonii]KAJ5817448.1 hypothetical protein N7447_009681 [Penicillium robsamsonii]
MEIRDSFTSIRQCRKALARVHVSLVDVLDGTQMLSLLDSTVRRPLPKYTKKSQKFFGRQLAKHDKAL